MKALVLTGDGINCEDETVFALTLAGLPAEKCHINTLVESPQRLKDYALLALPGGFSFGDEVSSGKILAVKLRHALGDLLYEYLEGDHLVIGVCNGFQALVKLGVSPEQPGPAATGHPYQQPATSFHQPLGHCPTPVEKSLF